MRALLPFLLLANTLATAQPIIKATMANTVKLNAFVDNWCLIYINGKLAAVDQIEFLPHNVVSVNILPSYPMTIAVLAKDNGDPKTGLEYTNQIGDGGFILKLGDGTITSAAWKVKTIFKGPLNRDTINPKVAYTPIPTNWFAPDFDDSSWPNATEYTQARVNPGGDFASYDFTNAKFIWSDDLDLDNTVLFRYTAPKPANFNKTWNADGDLNITNIVNEARLAPATNPHLYESNADAQATGYLTRVRGNQQITEQFANTAVDLGPSTDQLFLILYGANLPTVNTASATIAGTTADLLYSGNLTPSNGVAQFNLALPRTLAGAGTVPIVITINGKASNTVYINIK